MVAIRPARLADSDGILTLLRQVNNVHEANRPDLFIKDKTKYTADELAAILGDDTRPIFVAAEGERVLGYAFCVTEPHKDCNNLHDNVTLYIDDICVEQTVRGTGIGKALFSFVRDFAREQGVYNLTLNVWDKNDAAFAFYKACGFHIQKYGMELLV